MKERPIIFNAEMVRAILDGRKTQTRRILVTRPTNHYDGFTFEAGKHHPHIVRGVMTLVSSEGISCPFGQVGDRLWVRETCQAKELESGLDVIRYPADDAEIPVKAHPLDAGNWIDLYRYRGKEGIKVPSIHMPRHACRLVLEITDVRVERLRSMSQQDARAEGVIAASGPMEAGLAFRQLWESIYGADSWQANPWVWVIEFKRVEGRG